MDRGKEHQHRYRYAEGSSDRLPGLAADLVRLKVDVIVVSSVPAAAAAKKATTTIPIVIAAAGDPVAAGLVESLSRPGGNITGFSQMTHETGSENGWSCSRRLFPSSPVWRCSGIRKVRLGTELARTSTPGRHLRIQLHSLEYGVPTISRKRSKTQSGRVPAPFSSQAEPVITTNLERIAGLAARNRPAVDISAGRNSRTLAVLRHMGRTVPTCTGAPLLSWTRSSRARNPRDLPVELPTKFALVINMKTAKALGITIPSDIMVQATRVIE